MERSHFNKQRILDRLNHLSHFAEKRKQSSVATRREELIGRVQGMFGDQLTIKKDVKEYSIEELEALVAKDIADAAAKQAVQ